MAHTGIYATSAEVIQKLGFNYPSTLINEVAINSLMLQAEGVANMVGRKVFAVDLSAFTALPAAGKYVLTEFTSNFVAIYGWNNKPTGEDKTTNRVEYEDKINVLRDGMLRAMSLLRDQKGVKFLTSGS